MMREPVSVEPTLCFPSLLTLVRSFFYPNELASPAQLLKNLKRADATE